VVPGTVRPADGPIPYKVYERPKPIGHELSVSAKRLRRNHEAGVVAVEGRLLAHAPSDRVRIRMHLVVEGVRRAGDADSGSVSSSEGMAACSATCGHATRTRS
jgi:hypothetical protein